MNVFSTLVMLTWLAVPLAAQQPEPEVTVYRSARAPDVTVVEGLFRVDPVLLGTAGCSYGVQLIVRDADRNVLKDERWTGQCPEQGGQIAAALETFEFAMPATRFTVEVAVYPQGQPHRARSKTITVEGLAPEARVSDLVLARRIGYVDEDSVPAGLWTVRRGTIGLQVASQLVVEPRDPQLAFYQELYPRPGEPMTGSVWALVKRLDGKELARVQVQELSGLTEPRPVAGAFPLEGLPRGDYTFETQVRLRDTTIVRMHPFRMAAEVVALPGGGRGWFHTLTEDQIREQFDAIVAFGLSRGEIQQYESLPIDARREFLTRQFGPQGPTPDDGEESALDAYLSRLEYVQARFGERSGMGSVAAWATPRGRIWMMRGEPSTQTERARPSIGKPYQIWHYAVGAGYAYLFVDDTGMGHYRLVFTNDPNEQSMPGWDRLVGVEALEDLARLGIRVRTGSAPQQ